MEKCQKGKGGEMREAGRNPTKTRYIEVLMLSIISICTICSKLYNIRYYVGRSVGRFQFEFFGVSGVHTACL